MTTVHVQFSLYFLFPVGREREQIYWAEDFCVTVPDGWWWHKLAVLGISRKLKLGRLSYTEAASKHTQEPRIRRRSSHTDWSGSEVLELGSRLNIYCCEYGLSLNQLQRDILQRATLRDQQPVQGERWAEGTGYLFWRAALKTHGSSLLSCGQAAMQTKNQLTPPPGHIQKYHSPDI